MSKTDAAIDLAPPELGGLVDAFAASQLFEELAGSDAIGVPDAVRPLLVAGLARSVAPLIVVLPRSRDAEAFEEELTTFMRDGEVAALPAWEVLPGESMSPTLDRMGTRIRSLQALKDGAAKVFVSSVRGVLQKAPKRFMEPILLTTGRTFPQDDLLEALVKFGYERNYLVERPGEFSVRGGIVDVFQPGGSQPVRIDYFGDEIADLKLFSISSQRSSTPVEAFEIHQTRELILDEEVRARAAALAEEEKDPQRRGDLTKISQGHLFPGVESYMGVLQDLVAPLSLAPEATVVLCDPKSISDRADDFLEQAGQWGGTDASALLAEPDEAFGDNAAIELWPFGRGEEGVDVPATGWDSHIGKPHDLAKALSELSKRAPVVVAGGPGADRAAEVMAEGGLLLSDTRAEIGGPPIISRASVRKGYRLTDTNGEVLLALVGEEDIFGKRRPVRPRTDDAEAAASALLLELASGDHVVHEAYGVGRYNGMVTRPVGGVSRDYLLISYAGDDRLYLPTDQLHVITKYTGGDSPRLHRLGSGEWEKAKSRAKRAVEDIAGELVVLYSKRSQADGFSFSPDTPWQRQLEDSFPFVETHDQARAITDVKMDMEKPSPMDRLVVGDVGFGKTEVAVRGAFKAIQDGKQVAVLVPTTILAQQHHATFTERFSGFPVRIEQLSRFRTPAEQKEVLEGLATGKVDIVVGTHRLLQGDVRFHDLGFLVVDEEHRFGVKHKETIKKMKESVDALTMTATPIPRTLEMAMTAIRDLSLIDTAPAERQPVLTYVGEADERMLAAAIRRELARDGQVFYVHNRVRSIRKAAREIRELVPGARVEIAHGQMSEAQLEDVMIDVWDGKIDVLVCTTIIESGLDIPAMNTLIVERADLLGLAQLYQLRGRVGRARERAYAYFLYPHEAALGVEATERLKILSEFTELGSGFKIALRDLEIRGAGNLLGAQQHGHIAAVGFDLYMKMMSKALRNLEGTEEPERPAVTIDLPVDAYVPASYIARESLRMDAYRHLDNARELEDVEAFSEELEDRYGPIPTPTAELLEVTKLRVLMIAHGISDVGLRDGILKVRPVALKDSQEVRMKRLFEGAEYKPASDSILVPAAEATAAWVADTLRAILA